MNRKDGVKAAASAKEAAKRLERMTAKDRESLRGRLSSDAAHTMGLLEKFAREATSARAKKVAGHVLFGALILGSVSACSFKLEMGYHGQTGRDDTTVSKDFVQTAKARKY